MATKKESGYRWIDKDPVLDVFREAVRRTGMSFGDIYRRHGPTVGTLQRWDKGITRRPQNITLAMAMNAMGFTQRWYSPEHGAYEAKYDQESIKKEATVKRLRVVNN